MTKEGVTYTDPNILSLKVGDATIACTANPADSNCEYNSISTDFPQITQISKNDDNTLSLGGTGFLTNVNGFTPKVKFLNIDASSVTVVDDTQVLAVFGNGIPLTTSSERVSLSFLDEST
jgi:hypothetical protein